MPKLRLKAVKTPEGFIEPSIMDILQEIPHEAKYEFDQEKSEFIADVKCDLEVLIGKLKEKGREREVALL